MDAITNPSKTLSVTDKIKVSSYNNGVLVDQSTTLKVKYFPDIEGIVFEHDKTIFIIVFAGFGALIILFIVCVAVLCKKQK
jgi:hypothetical protein